MPEPCLSAERPGWRRDERKPREGSRRVRILMPPLGSLCGTCELTSISSSIRRYVRQRYSRVPVQRFDMSIKHSAPDRLDGDDEDLELGGLDERIQRVREYKARSSVRPFWYASPSQRETRSR